MKAFHPLSSLVARSAAAAVVSILLSSPLLAQEHHIIARPLTHQEIADYNLSHDLHPSGGLMTAGIGNPLYLEALVVKGAPVANVAWELTSRPFTSTVALAASPLPADFPTYEPADRRDFDVASRSFLKPDAVGRYTVTATVSFTDGSPNAVLTANIVGALYVGVGGQGGAMPAYPQCALCHNYEIVPGWDKVSRWQQTGHATFLAEAIDGIKSSHYNEGCIDCHTLGFNTDPAAKNNGFDDVAAKVGWTFPDILQPGNWDAMPSALKQVSNIQCENCHGAGSEHHGDVTATSVSFSTGNCAQCHDEKPYHIKNQEWNVSKHALAVREESSNCAGCHQGIGFVDRMKGLSPVRAEYAPIGCAACHEPHDAANPHQLRSLGDVTLMDASKPGGATVVTGGGNGKICMQCHISRRDAVTYVENTSGSSRFGPHHGPQTDMFVGANAITYGQNIPSSAHYYAIEDSCAACHAVGTSRTSPEHLKAGGHTFQPRWDGDTPDDPSDDVDLVGACSSCHGPLTSFNFARQDYDGDGVIEGVQTEVEGLLHDLAMRLPPYGEPTVNVTRSYTKPELKAVYNYLFVEEDGSLGVHNTAYAVGILKASIADLDAQDGDLDNDGLLDQWEIDHFGSIEAQDGQGDFDEDGVNNALEAAMDIDPTKADSDGDNFNDLAEIQSGNNPADPDDNPGLEAHIYNAAEFEFSSAVGKTYQIQAVTVAQGSWQDLGEPIQGDGDMVKRYITTRTNLQQYYRVVELPANGN